MSLQATSSQLVENKILIIRYTKIILDKDLANLYGVQTKRLNEQVKRNKKRFPKDFMFQLTKKETNELVAKCDRFKPLKHSTSRPYAFTEQGVAMLSSVLNSEKAIEVNIEIMRIFVQLREILSTHKELIEKFKEHNQKLGKHEKEIQIIFEVIKQLMEKPREPKKSPIGFHA